MNLPDLRKRILAGEEPSVDEIRQAILYQITLRQNALNRVNSKEQPAIAAEPKPVKEPIPKVAPKPTKKVQASRLTALLSDLNA